MIVYEPSWTPQPEADATLEENWLFRLRRERFRSRNSGKAHDFFVLHLADVVNVIALTRGRELVLVRQFRAGSGQDSLETPGGLLDPGEDPLDAAARELLEETGYAGDEPRVLGTVWSNPSILTSRATTVVIANAEQRAVPKLDEGEEVEVVRVPARRIPESIRNGEINHSLVVAGLLWWMTSELPDSPMEAWPGSGSPWLQFRIRSLITLVTGSALVFGFVANFGVLPLIVLATIFLFGLSHWLIQWKLDPPTDCPLIAEAWVPKRKLMRVLASFGLSFLIFAALAILVSVARR